MPTKKTSIEMDEKLWKDASIAAIQRGVTLKTAIEIGLRAWVDGKIGEGTVQQVTPGSLVLSDPDEIELWNAMLNLASTKAGAQYVARAMEGGQIKKGGDRQKSTG